jgi:hypothetical protein
MCSSKHSVDPFTDINGLVALFLDDIAERPVPRGAESLLAEIRQAAADGTATMAMATTIVDLFPYDAPG